MGSFNVTCGLSGLGITFYRDARFVMLTQNPFARPDRTTTSSFDEWFPRCAALRGKYDDYGNLAVDTAASTGAIQALVRGFSKDTHIQGPGPNPYHDLEMTRNMSFEDIMRRVGCGLHVDVDPDRLPSETVYLLDVRSECFRWLNSIRYSQPAVPSFELNVRALGPCRVLVTFRNSDHGDFAQCRWEMVDSLKSFLSEHYGVVVTPPSDLDRYPELQIFPRWTAAEESTALQEAHGLSYRAPIVSREKPPLAVGALWVREDVWQCFLEINQAFYSAEAMTITRFKDALLDELPEFLRITRMSYECAQRGENDRPVRLASNDRCAELNTRRDDAAHAAVFYDSSMFFRSFLTLGVKDHLWLAGEDHAAGLLTEAAVERFVLDTAETIWVLCGAAQVRRWVCRPSGTSGPQFDDVRAVRDMLDNLRQLAQNDVYAEMQAENADDIDE